jgi:hypothetical protein
MLTVNYGDVSGIGFGGTDNWGKDFLELYVGCHKNDVNYDGVMVDSIEVQARSGWCACEVINGGTALKYTALEDNPYKQPRTAYFYHRTSDSTVKKGFNAGRPVLKEWPVTVVQNGNPDGKDEEPQPKDIGAYKYSVGLISDLHICKDNDSQTPETSDDWWDEDDFRRAMDIFSADSNVKFVSCCGDLIESGSPKKKTPEDDSKEFMDMYDVPYWQI